jgi:glycosyltransferase involved in cell wall biosynthesis
MSRPRLSAAVLTCNEERNIGRCLASLAWADELVVVDSGSTDRTIEIARRAGARVHHRPWSGFLEQRRACLDLCAGEWILFLDADEWVPPELAAEIRQAIGAMGACGAFWIGRRNRFLDRWIDGAWAPDRLVRLFRAGTATLEGHEPHVHVTLPPGVRAGTLAHRIHHAAYDSISEMLAKVNR